MRIDKYLKVARILKRRVIAKELADQDRLLVNGRKVKAAYEVKVGDEITIIFGHRALKVKVLEIREHVKKEDSLTLYSITEKKDEESVKQISHDYI